MYYVITVKRKVPMRENETMTNLYAIRADKMTMREYNRYLNSMESIKNNLIGGYSYLSLFANYIIIPVSMSLRIRFSMFTARILNFIPINLMMWVLWHILYSI